MLYLKKKSDLLKLNYYFKNAEIFFYSSKKKKVKINEKLKHFFKFNTITFFVMLCNFIEK